MPASGGALGRMLRKDTAHSLYSACHLCGNIPPGDAYPSVGDDSSLFGQTLRSVKVIKTMPKVPRP